MSQLIQFGGQDPNNTKIIIVGVLVFIMFVIIGFYFMSATPTPTPYTAASTPYAAPTPSAPTPSAPTPSAPTPSAQKYLYLKPGAGWPYKDATNVDYAGAQAYCKSNNSRLATMNEINSAYASQKINAPVWGWTQGKKLTYTTNKQYSWDKEPGVQAPITNAAGTLRRSAWCYGPKPATGIKYAWKV